MSTQQTATPMTHAPSRPRGGSTLIAAALAFVLFYLSVDVVMPSLASSALPMPDAPVSEARAWFAKNQTAAVAMGLGQLLSVAALALFVTRLRSIVGTAATRASRWGLVAVASMIVASIAAWLLAALAPGASLDAVSALRTANFVAGGTAHVLPLGVFVVLVSRLPGISRPVRTLGYIAATPAAVSVVSLLWFQGAAFILLGRLLCMIWMLTAAVSVARGRSKGFSA